jgi:hypothetical protein
VDGVNQRTDQKQFRNNHGVVFKTYRCVRLITSSRNKKENTNLFQPIPLDLLHPNDGRNPLDADKVPLADALERRRPLRPLLVDGLLQLLAQHALAPVVLVQAVRPRVRRQPALAHRALQPALRRRRPALRLRHLAADAALHLGQHARRAGRVVGLALALGGGELAPFLLLCHLRLRLRFRGGGGRLPTAPAPAAGPAAAAAVLLAQVVRPARRGAAVLLAGAVEPLERLAHLPALEAEAAIRLR